MADTNIELVGEKLIGSRSQTTGGDLVSSRQAPIIDIQTRERTYEKETPGQIEPRALYEFYSHESRSFEVDVPIAVISRILEESIARLRLAASEQDQLEVENHVSVAWSRVKSLARYIGTWPAFDDAISLVFVSFETHRAVPYNTRELVSLQKVLEMMRRNPLPTDDETGIIFDALENAGFNLDAPLAEVDLNREDEEL